MRFGQTSIARLTQTKSSNVLSQQQCLELESPRSLPADCTCASTPAFVAVDATIAASPVEPGAQMRPRGTFSGRATIRVKEGHLL
jgi:hypothetical protein